MVLQGLGVLKITNHKKTNKNIKLSLPHITFTSKDSLRKNYCLNCMVFKDTPKKIKKINHFTREEFSKISYCEDCGTTLIRKNLFFDIGGGD